MNTSGKIVAGVSIFSTLFMGCYSSVLVDPLGDEKEEVISHYVESVVMKDGTKCEFDNPAKVVGDAILGQVNGNDVSIPLSQIGKAEISYFNTAGWIILVATLGGVIGLAIAIDAAGGIPSGGIDF